MVKIYVAAPWVHREAAEGLAKILEINGYTVTHPWWKYEGEGEHKESNEMLTKFALADVEGVVTADYVVVLNTAKSEGKAVEQGIAITEGIPIICITPGEKPSSNIFHYLPCYVHVKSIDEALEYLNGRH